MPKKYYKRNYVRPRYIETVRTVNSHSLQEWNELVQDNNDFRFQVSQLKENIKRLENFINGAMLSDSQVESKIIDLTQPPPIIDLTDDFLDDFFE